MSRDVTTSGKQRKTRRVVCSICPLHGTNHHRSNGRRSRGNNMFSTSRRRLSSRTRTLRVSEEREISGQLERCPAYGELTCGARCQDDILACNVKMSDEGGDRLDLRTVSRLTSLLCVLISARQSSYYLVSDVLFY